MADAMAPRTIATVGAVVTLLSLMMPFDQGSGQVLVNPLRVVGCAIAVGCAMLYALLRLWRDPRASVAKRITYSTCLNVAVLAYVMAQWSVWGRTRLRPLEMRFGYWRWIAVMAAAVVVACVFSAAVIAFRLLRR